MTQPATRYAQLWGGPMDGEQVWLGAGDLPHRVGMHRCEDGALVPISGRILHLDMPVVAEHVQVYERVSIEIQRGWIAACGRHTPVTGWIDGTLYVHRDLVTRWLAAGSGT